MVEKLCSEFVEVVFGDWKSEKVFLYSKGFHRETLDGCQAGLQARAGGRLRALIDKVAEL